MQKTSHSMRAAPIALVAIAALAAMPCLAAEGSGKAPTAVDEAAAQKAYIERSFEKIDTNHDGQIDKQEWQAFITAYLQKQKQDFDASFAAADKNHDGKLSRKEAQEANPLLAKYFDDIDADGDGFITPDEIRAAMVQKQMESVDEIKPETPAQK
ncbi:EF-hand domain-containing protein [Rudaea sp.]|uniref:EF-hand domain-containing protein n=1 Tax=Rudaea sp. TaxID=2136325 RepID=UPI00321FC542